MSPDPVVYQLRVLKGGYQHGHTVTLVGTANAPDAAGVAAAVERVRASQRRVVPIASSGRGVCAGRSHVSNPESTPLARADSGRAWPCGLGWRLARGRPGNISQVGAAAQAATPVGADHQGNV